MHLEFTSEAYSHINSTDNSAYTLHTVYINKTEVAVLSLPIVSIIILLPRTSYETVTRSQSVNITSRLSHSV